MSTPTKCAVIVGARPNFIKVAPFMRYAQHQKDFEIQLIHTGQHYDSQMSGVFFSQLGIPEPTISLHVPEGSHTRKIALMIRSLRSFFETERFNLAVVFGDVNSTLAGALAATKQNIPLVHVEAGLRSHDRRMPEEINRVIVDHLSDFLFVSERSGIENLISEGIAGDKMRLVGNIMIEALELYAPEIANSTVLNTLELKSKDYLVATIHRQENTDSPSMLRPILDLLQDLSSRGPVVFPLHPGTRQKIENFGFSSSLEKLKVIQPLSYFDFIKLVGESKGVVTDSGGIQEETSHLGIACCTLRDNTERPITVSLGSNRLYDIRTSTSSDLLEHINRTDFKSHHIPHWDARVSARIFDVLKTLI